MNKNYAFVAPLIVLSMYIKASQLQIAQVVLKNHLHAMNNNKVELHAAIGKGDYDRTKALLDSGVDREAAGINGSRPLHLAVLKGLDKIVELLLARGADKNAQAGDGLYTPLHFAVLRGHKEVVKLLLDSMADMETANEDGQTPLQLAAMYGHEEIVSMLLNAGANMDVQDKEANCPLHVAVWQGHVGVVRLLLRTHGNRNSQRATPLHVAAENGGLQVINELLNAGADKEAQNRKGSTPLHIAAREGHEEIVKLLLERQAKIEARDDEGWTALHFGCQNGHTEVVNELLNAGANKEARTKKGWTPLHIAAREGHEEIIKLLLEREVRIEARDDEGQTALHFACQKGHEEVVIELLDAGADKEAKTDTGLTPLHHAVIGEAAEIVLLLLRYQVDAECKTNQSAKVYSYMTPAEIAQNKLVSKFPHLRSTKNCPIEFLNTPGHETIKKIMYFLLFYLHEEIKKRKGNRNTLNKLLQNNFIRQENYAVFVLLALGADADLEINGEPLLFIAIRKGANDIVLELLKAGANANKHQKDGFRPLHCAAIRGDAEIAAMLLSAGADIEAKYQGCTSLVLAAQNRNASVIRVLLTAGARADVYRPPYWLFSWFSNGTNVLELFGGRSVESNEDFECRQLLREHLVQFSIL